MVKWYCPVAVYMVDEYMVVGAKVLWIDLKLCMFKIKVNNINIVSSTLS